MDHATDSLTRLEPTKGQRWNALRTCAKQVMTEGACEFKAASSALIIDHTDFEIVIPKGWWGSFYFFQKDSENEEIDQFFLAIYSGSKYRTIGQVDVKKQLTPPNRPELLALHLSSQELRSASFIKINQREWLAWQSERAGQLKNEIRTQLNFMTVVGNTKWTFIIRPDWGHERPRNDAEDVLRGSDIEKMKLSFQIKSLAAGQSTAQN